MKIDSPRGAIIDGKLVLKWNPAFQPEWTEKFKEAQKIIDMDVLKFNARYIPFQTGALNHSGELGTEIGSGRVVYNAPYARYMYYGKVMRDAQGRAYYGKAPKHVTTEDIQYHGAPQRGAFWFERMKQAHKEQIRRDAAKKLR